MGGRRHLGPMKATAEAMTAHSGGFFASSSLPRTFVDPAKCFLPLEHCVGFPLKRKG